MIQVISAINGINFNGLKKFEFPKSATGKYEKRREVVNDSEFLLSSKQKQTTKSQTALQGIKKIATKLKQKRKELNEYPAEPSKTPEELLKERKKDKRELIASLIALGVTIVAFSYFVLPMIVFFCKIRSFLK